jgi:putative SOS response-associated peptidase YedK
MCGRFVRHSSLELIENTFNVDASASKRLKPSYNIAPTQDVWAVFLAGGRRLDVFHWGLVPFWAKDPSVGPRMINARAETVDSKPSFRNAFKKRRCLIIADGFFEWKGAKGRKQPWYITPPTGGPMAFAGIWETWHRKGGSPDETLRSCAIITTAASPAIADIHDRMPVILKPEAYQPWLQGDEYSPDQLKKILQNHIVNEFNRHPVTPRVNSSRYDAADGITPLHDPPA